MTTRNVPRTDYSKQGERGFSGGRGPTGAPGAAGAQGDDGIQGSTSIVIMLKGTAGAGSITSHGQASFNSLTPSAVTSLIISKNDIHNIDHAAWMNHWAKNSSPPGGHLQITQKDDHSNFGIYEVLQKSQYITLPIRYNFTLSFISGGGTFTVNKHYVLSHTLRGAPGAVGAAGATGQQGTAGAAGTNGADGADGVDGVDGADGATGPQGPQGPGTITAGPWKSLCYFGPGNSSGNNDKISHIPHTEYNIGNRRPHDRLW